METITEKLPALATFRGDKTMKIIIATDGSNFSREAIETACKMMIDPENTEVKVVSVYQSYIPLDAFPQSAQYSIEFENSMKKVAESSTEEAVSTIQNHFANSKINTSSQVVVGASDQAIIEIAKDWNADLIIVGSHGHGFWGRLMIGSVSDSIVHNAPCSVLVVRKKVIS
jgi:nucleotide-binding universal stress UspA family protein